MTKTQGDRPAEPNKKVNLSDIKGDLVKRGKPPYENPALLADIMALDATIEGDAFLWAEGTVNPSGDPKVVHKERVRYRNRAFSVAEQCGRNINVNWMNDGQPVISLNLD